MRKTTAAEQQIKAALGSLADAISGLDGVVGSVDFCDVELADSVDADAAGVAVELW